MFIPNRDMLDSVLVVNEVMDFSQRNNKDIFAFKFDFEKVFDSMSWEFLLYVMK